MNISNSSRTLSALNKVPEITLGFWVIKIMSTTVGETGADFLAVNAGLGQGLTRTVMAALLAVAYVLFLAFAFHGPSHWAGNQSEFGFFVDHFTFSAGLLFAAVHGPGTQFAIKRGWLM